jgi:two-component system, LuxR family, sensor kinase FixL
MTLRHEPRGTNHSVGQARRAGLNLTRTRRSLYVSLSDKDGGFVIDAGVPVPTMSAAALSRVLDSAADGILVVDDQARILLFNAACEHLFGRSAADMLGRRADTIILPDGGETGADAAADGAGALIATLRARREVWGRHRDGTLFPLDPTVGETTTADGPQLVAILRDLRPRRQAEHRRQQVQGEIMRMLRMLALDELGAALSHEVNQPLTALMLYLQAVARAIEKQTPGSDLSKVLTILEKAAHEAERVGDIVQRVRQFTEKRSPERQLVDLAPLVTEAIELAVVGSAPSTRIIQVSAPDLPRVLVDPLQIQQVVVNLVRNALETNKLRLASEVRVVTRREAHQILVVVEDDGPGIPPETLRDLFKPFSARMVEGLGLAISRTIAQNHGGALSVDPGNGGHGARYALTLPLPPAEAG